MTKKITEDEFLERLKFTPCTYKISLWGYGGEKVMGTVSREAWDYCMDNQVDLSDIAWQSDAAESMGLDAEKLPFPPGSWYECDDMAHVSGVSRSAGTLQIEDEKGNTVFEKSLDDCDGCDDSPEWCCEDEVWVGMREPGEIVFVGTSNEKGTFFEADLELKAPFEIEKLSLHYDEIDGEEIVNRVYYDGVEIDNWGGSTDGKSSDFTMCLVKENNTWERYEPGEKDWGHPEFGTSPSDWESSPKFKFKQHKPVHVGYYSVNYSNGSTYGSLYWDGENFGEWEFGKFNPVNQKGVVTWQGYNWDTSSWVNQPTEPPALVCSNKKCGWVGKHADRITDDDFNEHCPECDGTDFDWIDYDPDTAKGRKNRKKYCREWDPVASLERIVLQLGEEVGASEEELAEIKSNRWPFGPSDTVESETVTESTSKWFTVKTYYKKSCEQHEHFIQNDGPGRITVKDGFRFAEFNVETNDGEFPKFDFTSCPGGSADLDSVDLFSCFGDNVEQTELVEMFDGGCWFDVEIEGIDDEDEVTRLEELINEEGSYALEDSGDWYLDETECWVWGPLEVTDDQGNTRIICADADGNMIDFVDE
jgi:hypothetical protein